VGDCPKCGLADPGPVDFCPNPQCRTYLGRASALAASQIPVQRTGSDVQSATAWPRQAVGAAGAQEPMRPSMGPSVAASSGVGASTGGSAAGPTQKRGVRVTMEPDDLTIDPGSQVTTKVTVRNLGTRVEEFELIVQGPGADFATVIPATVSVYPDVEQRAVVRFAPLRGPQSPAGVSTFEVVARSVVHSDVRDVARGRLTVTAFEDLQAVLKPESSRGRQPARHLVSVTNGGNTPVNSQVAFTDQDKVLTFEPPNTAVTLQPGGTAEVPVLLNGPRRWFGRTERLPFAAVVTPAGAQPPITLNGTRQQTAVFPWWMPPAALAIVALAIGLAALIKSLLGSPTVPTIGNEDQQVAVKKLEDAQYVPALIYKTDNNVDKGYTVGTDPAANTPLAHGQMVKLIISQGKCAGTCPDMVAVPNVVGLQQDTATALLQKLNLGFRPQQKPGDDPAGQVTDQDPKPNTPSAVGTPVLLTVSSGPKNPPANQPGSGAAAAAGGAAVGGAAGGAAGGGGAPGGGGGGGGAPGGGSGGGGAPGGGGGGGPQTPQQVAIPALKNSSAAEATAALEKLGLKVKTESVHSNAVADGKVLSSKPDASKKVDPGSDVTLTVAQNTARIYLIDTGDKATWTATATKSERLTFGTPGDITKGLVNQRAGSLNSATGSVNPTPVTAVLETRPPDQGLITGEYQLASPVVSGDHVKALVGLLNTSSTTTSSPTDATNKIIFTIEVNGQAIKSVTAKPGTPQTLDADLSSAEGASSVKLIVTSSGTQDSNLTPVWQSLRLEPTIGK
jgi:beta-lactam-binding protein with PASTA domain